MLRLTAQDETGWCRIERMVHESAGHGPFVVIRSAKDLQLVATSFFASYGSSPGLGDFSIEQDRLKTALVLKQVLLRRMRQSLRKGDFATYRVVLNAQVALFRGLPVEPLRGLGLDTDGPDESIPRTVAEFLHRNCFRHALEYDSAGWSPLCYACMSGDLPVIRGLLEVSADANDQTRKAQPILALFAANTVLGLCALFQNNDAMKLLISAKAKVNARKGTFPPILGAIFANNVEGIRILRQHGASANVAAPTGISAVQQACTTGSLEVLQVLLFETESRLPLTQALHHAAIFQDSSAKIVRMLVSARADINEQYKGSFRTVLGLVLRMRGLQYKLGGKATKSRVLGYHHRGATPLMMAILAGQFECAAALAVAGARLDLQNSRRKKAEDLAKQLDVPEFLMEALHGRVERCAAVVSLDASEGNCTVSP